MGWKANTFWRASDLEWGRESSFPSFVENAVYLGVEYPNSSQNKPRGQHNGLTVQYSTFSKGCVT